jgi:type I restriction enzyme S subunit
MQSVITYYRNLTRWDIKNYLWLFQSSYPVESLGKYIYEHSEKENISEQKDKEFPILGVTNKEGVYLNEYVKGKDINQPYKKVKKGELTYNPYRVNVGSIGIVQDEYDGFYISPAYVVFGTKENLLNEYIYLVLSSSWFNPYLRASTSGSVRQNLTFELLSELKVPIPQLKIQRKIIDLWHKAQNEAQSLKAEVKKKGNEIEDYVFSELGISRNVSQKKKGVFVVRFMELERWDTYFNSQQRLIKILSGGKYQISVLKSLCNYLDYGLMPLQDYAQNAEDGIPYIRVTNITKDGNLDFNDVKYIPKRVKFDEGDKVREDDILLVQAGATTGKSALVPKKVEGYLAASFMFVIRLKKDMAFPKYVFTILQSSIFTNQVRANLLLNKSTRLYITKPIAEDLKIPLPPMVKQIKIAERVDDMRVEISKIKNKTESILENTKQEIGKMLRR